MWRVFLAFEGTVLGALGQCETNYADRRGLENVEISIDFVCVHQWTGLMKMFVWNAIVVQIKVCWFPTCSICVFDVACDCYVLHPKMQGTRGSIYASLRGVFEV